MSSIKLSNCTAGKLRTVFVLFVDKIFKHAICTASKREGSFVAYFYGLLHFNQTIITIINCAETHKLFI